jgi:Fe-S oxidoreductase
VKENNPEFAQWTAKERIKEAESTGAQAIVTACPGCEKILSETIKENGDGFELYDVVELIEQATS